MANNIFKRCEFKYMLSCEQAEMLKETIAPYMKPDAYGKTTIRNLYFDTDTYLLIRRSIEKPIYKEKLRIRSYCQADYNTGIFAELKKKYNSIVYKRRIALPYGEALEWLVNDKKLSSQTQISNEIDYFKSYYGTLCPTVFLAYDREAFFSTDDTGFRITFDTNILARTKDLSLTSPVYGMDVLPLNKVLMEIKCTGGIPLWMVNILSKEKIYKTSFSKYGTVYKEFIFPKLKKGKSYYA